MKNCENSTLDWSYFSGGGQPKHIPDGIYTIQLITDQETVIEKVTKMK